MEGCFHGSLRFAQAEVALSLSGLRGEFPTPIIVHWGWGSGPPACRVQAGAGFENISCGRERPRNNDGSGVACGSEARAREARSVQPNSCQNHQQIWVADCYPVGLAVAVEVPHRDRKNAT